VSGCAPGGSGQPASTGFGGGGTPASRFWLAVHQLLPRSNALWGLGASAEPSPPRPHCVFGLQNEGPSEGWRLAEEGLQPGHEFPPIPTADLPLETTEPVGFTLMLLPIEDKNRPENTCFWTTHLDKRIAQFSGAFRGIDSWSFWTALFSIQQAQKRGLRDLQFPGNLPGTQPLIPESESLFTVHNTRGLPSRLPSLCALLRPALTRSASVTCALWRATPSVP
jgi:hypothetical protein